LAFWKLFFPYLFDFLALKSSNTLFENLSLPALNSMSEMDLFGQMSRFDVFYALLSSILDGQSVFASLPTSPDQLSKRA
jgi:hypothetical protein